MRNKINSWELKIDLKFSSLVFQFFHANYLTFAVLIQEENYRRVSTSCLEKEYEYKVEIMTINRVIAFHVEARLAC